MTTSPVCSSTSGAPRRRPIRFSFGSWVQTGIDSVVLPLAFTRTFALGRSLKSSFSRPMATASILAPFLSTTRSLRGRFTFSASTRPSRPGLCSLRFDHGDMGTHSSVPQSSSRMVTSWHTSTRRRVRYPESAVRSAVSARPLRAPCVEMKNSRTERPSMKLDLIGRSMISPFGFDI